MLLAEDGLDEHREGSVDWEHLEELGAFGAAPQVGEEMDEDDRVDEEQVGSVWTRRYMDADGNNVVVGRHSDYTAVGWMEGGEREEVEVDHTELTQLLVNNFSYMRAQRLVEWV